MRENDDTIEKPTCPICETTLVEDPRMGEELVCPSCLEAWKPEELEE